MASPPERRLRPPRAILVVGSPRSGTTLLRALLDGHPSLLVAPYESGVTAWCGASHPAAALLVARPSWVQVPRPGRLVGELDALVPGPTDPATALEALAEALARSRVGGDGRSAWVEKTPTHLRILPVLRSRLGAETRTLCLVRDPRAVLASRIRRWGRDSERAITHFARKWALDDALAQRFEADDPGFRVVRYEDLVQDPGRVMQDVADHVGIDWDESLLQPLRNGSPIDDDGRPVGVSARSVQRWQHELLPGQVARLESLLRAPMRARGYGPRFTDAWHPRRALLALRVRWAMARLQRTWRVMRHHQRRAPISI